MQKRRAPRIHLLLGGALIALVALAAGIFLGGNASLLPDPVREALVRDDEAQLVQSVIDTIEDNYYRQLRRDELVDQSIEGAVESLDDQFSHYFDPATYRRFQQSTNPRFSGIGVTVQPHERGLVIAHVIPGTPAERAGLRAGDKIVAVGRNTLAGHPSSYAIGLIKGEPGTTVSVTIERDGERSVETIERAEIVEPVVEGRLVSTRAGRYGHVVFTSFTSSSSEQVRAAVESLLRRGARGIVLDLRGNGGGLLREAVDTASIFIPDGTIVSTDGRNRPRHVYTASGGAIDGKVPVVVLVDRNSASASEIVTGALQDRRRAAVVGTRTYGKGVFQKLFDLANGGALDLTIGEYYTADGVSLAGKGLQPDIKVSDNPETPRDEAFQRGIQVLLDEIDTSS